MTAFADAFPEYAFKSERAQVALDIIESPNPLLPDHSGSV